LLLGQCRSAFQLSALRRVVQVGRLALRVTVLAGAYSPTVTGDFGRPRCFAIGAILLLGQLLLSHGCLLFEALRIAAGGKGRCSFGELRVPLGPKPSSGLIRPLRRGVQ